MRCAVDGCRPVCSLTSFSDTGSWYEANTSSSANVRSNTCMVGALASGFFMEPIFTQILIILHGENRNCMPGVAARGLGLDCAPVLAGGASAERGGGAAGGECRIGIP